MTNDVSLEGLIREQAYLAKHGNIGISDTENIPDFERTVFVGIIAEMIKRENEALQQK